MGIIPVDIRSEADAVYFSKSQLLFSASLVTTYGLDQYEWVRVGVDPELRRVYFAFQDEGGLGTAKFYRQKNSTRRMFAIGSLYAQYDWIAAIRDEPDKAKRRFIFEALRQNLWVN